MTKQEVDGTRLRRAGPVLIWVFVTTLIFGVLAPAPAVGAEEIDAGATVDAVLLEHPELIRVPGGMPSVNLAGGELSATTVLAAEPFYGPEIAGLEGDLAADRVVEMVRHESQGKGSLSGRRLVMADSESDVATIVEGYADGLRMFEVIETKRSAHNFSYGISIDGRQASFLTQDDGTIVVGWGNQDDFTAVGQVDVPWAYDANGESIDVAYKVVANGKTLKLSVDKVKGAAYPVTADPSFTSWVGEVHCSWGSCTFYLERVKTYWIRDIFATKSFAVASAMIATSLCGWIVAGTSFTGVGAFFAGLACAGYIAAVIWDIQHHSNQGWACLTFKKYHWSTWISVGHASGSSSHCHYNA